MSVRKILRLDQIEIRGGTQARVDLRDEETVAEYQALYQADKVDLPPLECVCDGEHYWLWDGFQRYFAAGMAGLTELPANVREGTLEDARWLCVSANITHGLRRSNADKRKAVQMALEQRPDLSNVAIAEHVGVSDEMVRGVRSQAQVPNFGASTGGPSPERRTGRDGKSYPANGRKEPSDAPSKSRKAKSAAPDVVVKDALGNAVPSVLRDVFADATLAEELAKVQAWHDGMTWRTVVLHLKAKIAAWPYLRLADVIRHLEAAHDALRVAAETIEAGTPHAVCPSCEGQGCEDCRKCGHVPAWRLRDLRSQEAGS